MEKEEILKEVKKRGTKFVDLQFVDILGVAKCTEIPIARLETALDEGIWFDGSSIEGFARIHESDMLLKPDSNTFSILPWTEGKVARIICDIHKDEKTPFEGDPRYILKKQLGKAKEMGFDFFVGPELEFFFFKENGTENKMEVHDKAGYFDLAPVDMSSEVKREVSLYLEEMGLKVEMLHHEVAPGQHEIDFRYGDALGIADSVMTYKHVVKTIAAKHGLFASFMPKPVFGINGSGMHTHQSLWKDGKNAFADESNEYKLSKEALFYISGIMEHARAFSAVTAPIVNSYKRLVPGYEAPVYICWARINRSALIRVPRDIKGKLSGIRIEVRCPDPSCNPYLAFSVMLASGLDGIREKKEPPKPVEENLYHFDDEKLRKFYIKTLPGSLGEALEEMEKDKVVGEALGEHVFSKFIEAKKGEWDEYRIQVTEWEKKKYFDVL